MENYYVSLFLQKEENQKKKEKKEKKGFKRSHYARGFRVKRNLPKRSCLYCIVLYCQNFISYFLNAKVNFENKIN